MNSIQVAIYLGSKSDIPTLKKAFSLLDEWKLPYRLHILSAHRTADALEKAIEKDIQDGAKIFIAAAGMAAALPGVIASKTILPVIGVPISASSLQGVDALYSIVQMPPGIPVATMGIGSAGALNAVLYAGQMLGGEWIQKVEAYRQKRADEVLSHNEISETKGWQAFE